MNPFGIAIAIFLFIVGAFILWGLCAINKQDEADLAMRQFYDFGGKGANGGDWG